MRKLSTWLLIAGIALLSHAFYMDAKGKLAQVLIAHSWAVASYSSADDDSVERHAAKQAPKPWWWADTRAIARLDIPRLDKQLFVMQDDSGESLAFGPGHLPSSAAPSASGHVMIAGHRDSHFAFLEELKKGDYIHTTNLQGQRKTYRVSDTRILNTQFEQFAKTQFDQLSLITCFPFNGLVPGGPLRYIVNAALIADGSSNMLLTYLSN